VEGKFPYSDNTRNARKFKYLAEFEAKMENTLDAYSGAQMGSFGQTSLKCKISCKCTFKRSMDLYQSIPCLSHFFLLLRHNEGGCSVCIRNVICFSNYCIGSTRLFPPLRYICTGLLPIHFERNYSSSSHISNVNKEPFEVMLKIRLV
jgi:hypothetical protein